MGVIGPGRPYMGDNRPRIKIHEYTNKSTHHRITKKSTWYRMIADSRNKKLVSNKPYFEALDVFLEVMSYHNM